MKYDSAEVLAQAQREWEEECNRDAVKRAKERLRAKAAHPWWVKLFPWRITIERKY